MNEEIMNYEEEVMVPEIESFEDFGEGSGGKTAVAVAIVAGVAAAGVAVVAFGKKLWNKHKAKKELRQPNEDEIVEVTEEQIIEATTAE